MAAPAEAKSLEQELLSLLKFSGLEKDHLTELVNWYEEMVRLSHAASPQRISEHALFSTAAAR